MNIREPSYDHGREWEVDLFDPTDESGDCVIWYATDDERTARSVAYQLLLAGLKPLIARRINPATGKPFVGAGVSG